jgi:DNA-binding transcriptional MocR family regulator
LVTSWLPDLQTRSGPRYLAIAQAIADDTANGRLKPGVRLPTHRELADRLGVTVGTVTRAYAEAARRGLVSGEVGRGTFARRAMDGTVPAGEGEGVVVDLSVNHPPVTTEDARHFRLTLEDIARRGDASRLLAYQPNAGAASHRSAGAEWIGRAGIEARPEQVLVCAGSQHALMTIFSTLVSPGEVVLCESVTYPGMKNLAGLLKLRLQGLALDAHGLRPDALEAACRRGAPRALYCVPTLQNPTGTIMPEARRQEIAAIAQSHGVPIVEDDVHGFLPVSRPRPLSAFAPESSFYVNSTSKSLAPGLRIGFLLSPPAYVSRLATAVGSTIWMVAPLMAEIVSTWIREGTADAVLAEKRQEAAARQSLARRVLAGSRIDSDASGYHLWLTLREPWRSESFVAEARRRGVAVTPAEAFAVDRDAVPPAVRVCLGPARSHAELERGLVVLAEILMASPESAMSIV